MTIVVQISYARNPSMGNSKQQAESALDKGHAASRLMAIVFYAMLPLYGG